MRPLRLPLRAFLFFIPRVISKTGAKHKQQTIKKYAVQAFLQCSPLRHDRTSCQTRRNPDTTEPGLRGARTPRNPDTRTPQNPDTAEPGPRNLHRGTRTLRNPARIQEGPGAAWRLHVRSPAAVNCIASRGDPHWALQRKMVPSACMNRCLGNVLPACLGWPGLT